MGFAARNCFSTLFVAYVGTEVDFVHGRTFEISKIIIIF